VSGRGGALGAFGALDHRPFRIYWIGQTVSSLGSGMSPVALAFAVLSRHGTATQLGLVLAVSMLAQVLFLLLGGVWADRLPRQRVMLLADLVRGTTQIVLGATLITGTTQIWELALGSFITSMANSVFKPASTGLVPETVPSDRLQQANSMMAIAVSGGMLAGPALAGVLIAVTSPGSVYVVDGVSFLVSVLSLAMLPLTARASRPRQGIVKDLAEGWQEVASRRWYWLGLISHGLWNMAIASFFVLGPVIAARQLGGAGAWGLIASGNAAGAIVGGLVAMRFKPRRPLVWSNLPVLLSAPLLLSLAVPLPALWVAGFTALAFCGIAFLNTVWMSVVQQRIPREALSRVSSYDWAISLVAMPAGYALVGPLSVWLGVGPTLVAACAVAVLPGLVIALLPTNRRMRYLEDDPEEAGHAPEETTVGE